MQNQSDRMVKIQKRFTVSPHAVWRAWTDAEIVKQWFGSDPNGTVLNAFLDVRLNGSFEITFANADGTAFTCLGMYQEVTPYQKLTFTWAWKNSPDIVEFITVMLQAEQHGTLMDFEIANIDPQSAHNYAPGWKSTFEKLERAIKHLNGSG